MTLACLQRWYASEAGEAVLDALQTHITEITSEVFGYYALEYGALGGKHAFLKESRIQHCFRATPGTQIELDVMAERSRPDLVMDADYLSVAFDNIDLLVATHVLDFSNDPHRVLREIERVLVPEGHCVLVGMNPLSLLGIRHAWRAFRKNPCVEQLYTSYRVREWFRVLGFDVIEVRTFGMCAQIPQALQERSPLGSVYVLHVRKKVSKMTPLKSGPKLRQRVLKKPEIAVSPSTGRVGRNARHSENS